MNDSFCAPFDEALSFVLLPHAAMLSPKAAQISVASTARIDVRSLRSLCVISPVEP
jgi:hypothetical protein